MPLIQYLNETNTIYKVTLFRLYVNTLLPILLRCRSSETNLSVLAFPSMRGTIICGAGFVVVSSNHERMEFSRLHLTSIEDLKQT